MSKLSREEYIEQAYVFKGLNNRLDESDPIQVVMRHLRDEVLSTTKLPMALDFLLAELMHVGTMATAMKKLAHYFEPFQTFIIENAEEDAGRFDIRRALLILEHEANFRAKNDDPVAMFFFHFETLCDNHLDYDYGLQAIAEDSTYDEKWKKWIREIRGRLGLVSLADLIYVYSEHYRARQQVIEDAQGTEVEMPEVVLFGEKEGRIALANRSKEPQYLFAALQRQLSYPAVPKPKLKSAVDEILPKLVKEMKRLEMRMKLMEDEQREKGIDLSQFYGKDDLPNQE